MHYEFLLIFHLRNQLPLRIKKWNCYYYSYCNDSNHSASSLFLHGLCHVRCTLTVSSPFIAPYTKECSHSWELQMSRLCVHDALSFTKTISSIAITRIRSNLSTSMGYYPSAISENPFTRLVPCFSFFIFQSIELLM